VVLIVRDGWGQNPHPEHDAFNAVKIAHTPRCNELLQNYPWTLIHTSGEAVGLPEGTMGNSEVGHQNLGASRVVYQESVRITVAIREGEFFENPVLVEAMHQARTSGKKVHLMGIGSDVGVHGRLGHLYACAELCQKQGVPKDNVKVHLFTDGRDSGPFTGKDYLKDIQANLQRIGVGSIASIVGRYYAMDRDNRWSRVQQAYNLLTGTGAAAAPNFPDFQAAITDYYNHPANDSQQGDEFVTPRTVGGHPQQSRIAEGDTVIFYNYRGDRPRELTRAFVFDDNAWKNVTPSPDTGEHGFDRGPRINTHYVTMTNYETGLPVKVAFEKPERMVNVAGQFLSDHKLTQFRCAETEKFPHVTFFFNDYREEPFPGEQREMAQSPAVATYDLQPEMSAPKICELVLQRLAAKDCEDFILVNFANGDMVGHTGKLDAAVKAVQTVDDCVGRIVDAALKRGGALIVTADHGNAEQMWDPLTNAPHTAHTTYDVQCIVVSEDQKDKATGDFTLPSGKLRSGGKLADVFPTVLELMGLDKPSQMTGRSLLQL
jgi:2,3-bisphosphoglycerate-independent phosphoglycerate mutase